MLSPGIPKETRNALQNVRIPCRIIGFSEDDSHEERKGYNIFISSTGAISWSMDVVMQIDKPMSCIGNTEAPSIADI
jgi:hypothetical protein